MQIEGGKYKGKGSAWFPIGMLLGLTRRRVLHRKMELTRSSGKIERSAEALWVNELTHPFPKHEN